ncbi:MAG: sigma-54-dependent Fis family transcriptional regulator [Calditrichaeota bacterium]|nr:sigma-54-dependent Fis family transcriptional regulator [Calditrichota bacterium]
MKFKILILDDEQIVCNSLQRILENKETDIFTSRETAEARRIICEREIDLVLLDYKLKNENGLNFLKEIREEHPEMPVIMITAFGNVDLAVEAMKSGAFDFIQKNQEPEFIRFTVKRTLENLRLRKEVQELRKSCLEENNLPEIVTVSSAMQKTLELANEFAKTDVTILITGETGTGKNLVGNYIHAKSMRFHQAYVSINCAAIPRELMESELFGYEKGAFTGAHERGKKGLIEQANKGTLFFDEIGELSPDLQGKLLHVLEENKYFKIGSVEPSSVDVRFIAASNTDLEEAVAEKKFRMDLFYRLNVAHIHIPPLRERKEDIIILAKFFIEEFNKKFNKTINDFTPEAQRFLESLSWPGNVRELKNLLERAVLLKKDNVLRLEDFGDGQMKQKGYHKDETFPSMLSLDLNNPGKDNLLNTAQKMIIEQALDYADHNRSRAARLLKIPRTTLNFYIRKHEIE